MAATTEVPLAAQLGAEPGSLLTGDLGLVALQALLEAGIGYVIGAWQDEPTPLDAVIREARGSVLARRGIVMRRLRSMETLAQIVTAPPQVGGGPVDVSAVARGAVIFGGQRGMRPTLESFTQLTVPGGVIGFCFDADAVRIPNALVLDPEQTARGIVEAVDAGLRASVALGRPTLIVIRERTLGMRGTIRTRRELSPLEAALTDASTPRSLSLSGASQTAGLAQVEISSDAPSKWVVTSAPLAATVRRVLAAHGADGVGVVVALAPEAVTADERITGVLSAAGEGGVLRVGTPGSRVPAETHSHLVAKVIAAWLELEPIRDASITDDELHARIAHVADRVPRRGEILNRSVSPQVAAALVLAQGVIGVPVRADATHPTYSTDTGVPITVVTGAAFAARGTECAAPGSLPGVFVVTGDASGVAERAAAAGVSVEYVDGHSPRIAGAAIGRASRQSRSAAHVIVMSEPQRVAAPRAGHSGLDPDLLGTDRIAVSAVPTDSTSVVEFGDNLSGGPIQIPLDTPATAAHIESLRALSPASWDVRVLGRARRSRWADAMWNLRRRLVRSLGGMDL